MPIVPDADEVLLEQLRLPDQPKSRRKPRARHVPFVQLQLPEAVAAFRVLKCPQAAVWLYINYRVWADGESTIPLPNQTLTDMGVSRKVKWRALQHLEQAGLIRVERRGRKSPLVTLL